MASYSYWRLYVLAGGGNPGGGSGNALSLAEWTFYDGSGVQIPTGTSGTPIASSSGSGAASNAFDGNINTFWGANVGAASYAPQWIEYHFPSAVTVGSFSLTARNDSYYVQAPDSWLLQASNDGLTWTAMGAYSLNSAWISAGQVQTFTVNPSRGTGPILRLLITSNFSTNAAAAEVDFYDSGGTQIPTTNGAALAYDDFPGYSGSQSAGPSSAFDGNVNTYWSSITNPNSTPVWIQYSFTPPFSIPTVARICVTTRNDSSYAQGPIGVTAQYSLDGGSTFINIVSKTFSAWTFVGETQCFAISIVGPTITCNSPPSGTVGTPYSHTFPASGGTTPYTFAIISGALPTGLTLNTSTGVVSGTPTASGTFPFTIQVTDANSLTGQANCSITITGSSLVMLCNNPPTVQSGVAYSYQISVSGGVPPYTFSLVSGSLPPGITLNTSTGILSGTAYTPGTYTFSVKVTDSVGATAVCPLLVIVVIATAANIYVLRDNKLTDDDYGQIYPYYVTYFCPTFDQEQALQLGGGRKLLAYMTAFVSGSQYLPGGCYLNVTFLCDQLGNPWALTVQRTLSPSPKFDMECGGGSAMGQRIAVKFASAPIAGTDNAFSLDKVIFFMKVQQRLPVRGSAT